MCPVVYHGLCGPDKLVIDAVTILVDDGDASQDAVLAARAHTHHLTIHGHHLRQAAKTQHRSGAKKTNAIKTADLDTHTNSTHLLTT